MEEPTDTTLGLHKELGMNASVPYTQLASGGAPSFRPLEFPAPTVDRSNSAGGYVIDHRSGKVFYATSILSRKAVHGKSCRLRYGDGRPGGEKNRYNNTVGGSPKHEKKAAGTSGHVRNGSRDSVHSWYNANTGHGNYHNSTYGQSQSMHSQSSHGRLQSDAAQQPCGPGCDLPTKAYCVRRKLCDTIYGSVRLCVVLRRIKRDSGDPFDGYGQEASWETTDQMVAIKVSLCVLSMWVDSLAFFLARHLSDVLRAHLMHKLMGIRQLPVDNIHMHCLFVFWWFVVSVVAFQFSQTICLKQVVNWSKLQQLRGRHLEDPIKELAAMQLLGNYHPHVINISDSLQDETHLFCVYPFISGGDLYDRLWQDMRRSPSGRVDETKARLWFRQILSALSHFQKKGVCHRDLCMENMMVDEHDNIKIIDLGLCLRVPYADPNNRNLVTDVSANSVRRLIKCCGQGGNWEYMAPEVSMQHESFDGFAIDLWAVGIVLFEFLIGKKPFAMPDAVDKNFQTISIDENLDGLLRLKGISLDADALDLLQKMLRYDPSRRLTLAEVVSHSWTMRGYNDSKPKRVLSSVEETNNSWFIQNNAIDDNNPDDYELAHRLRINSCSSNDGPDDITAESTDEESRNPRGCLIPTISEMLHTFPYNISDEQLSEDYHNYKIDDTQSMSELQSEQASTILEHDMLDRINAKQKKKGFSSYLNPKKLWKHHTKKPSSLTTVASATSCESIVDPPPKVEMQGDGRMC